MDTYDCPHSETEMQRAADEYVMATIKVGGFPPIVATIAGHWLAHTRPSCELFIYGLTVRTAAHYKAYLGACIAAGRPWPFNRLPVSLKRISRIATGVELIESEDTDMTNPTIIGKVAATRAWATMMNGDAAAARDHLAVALADHDPEEPHTAAAMIAHLTALILSLEGQPILRYRRGSQIQMPPL